MLSGRQVIVKEIRADDQDPGLRPHEFNLLKLLEKVTNGAEFNINKTGTRIIMKPGIIDCNEGMPIEHQCDLGRSMTYYLECILLLGIFGKTTMNLTLMGNTDDDVDQSIDSLKTVMLHLLNQFGAADTLHLQIKKRGYAPLGGGIVTVTQQYAKKLESISLIDEGKIKRVRGLVTSAKVSPQLTTRVVDKVREVFNDYIPDVWVNTDHYKKGLCGEQPGYAISLSCETTTGMVLTKDFNFGNKKEFILPEELGERCSYGLLDEISAGGCVDTTNQPVALMLMALTSGDNISQIKIGRVTQQSIAMLQNLKKFFNIQFKIEECDDEVYDASDSEEENQQNSDEEEGEQEIKEMSDESDDQNEGEEKPRFAQTFIFSCIGITLTNFARKME